VDEADKAGGGRFQNEAHHGANDVDEADKAEGGRVDNLAHAVDQTKVAGRFYRRLQGRSSAKNCSEAARLHSQIDFEGRVLGSYDCRAIKRFPFGTNVLLGRLVLRIGGGLSIAEVGAASANVSALKRTCHAFIHSFFFIRDWSTP
jgi:hypothetical protein